MKRTRNQTEPATTEITIAPDGRVFIFGLSRAVLEIAQSLSPNDARLARRLARVAASESNFHEEPETEGINR